MKDGELGRRRGWGGAMGERVGGWGGGEMEEDGCGYSWAAGR